MCAPTALLVNTQMDKLITSAVTVLLVPTLWVLQWDPWVHVRHVLREPTPMSQDATLCAISVLWERILPIPQDERTVKIVPLVQKIQTWVRLWPRSVLIVRQGSHRSQVQTIVRHVLVDTLLLHLVNPVAVFVQPERTLMPKPLYVQIVHWEHQMGHPDQRDWGHAWTVQQEPTHLPWLHRSVLDVWPEPIPQPLVPPRVQYASSAHWEPSRM
mmetsp:Transcript_7849/g.29385  ORF Transcript_7849/g.29385 Transcript_7849/m.29385 type:complete len:213 (-) Transcript_7849:3225-3863(-)